MKILFLSTGLGHGGAETQLVRLAKTLRSRGHQPRVVTMLPPESKPLQEILDTHDVPLKSLGMQRGKLSARTFLEFFNLVRADQPDVVCSFMYHANILGTTAARLAGVPTVVSSIRGERFGGAKRMVVAGAFHRLDHTTTTNSKRVAQVMIDRGVVPSNQMTVIPNAIDVDVFDAAIRNRKHVRKDVFQVSDKTFVWLAVGRVEAPKDYSNLVRATTSKQAVFVAGKYNSLSDINALDPNHKLKWLGFRKDVPSLLAGCDGLVLSSAHEGLPNAVLEAHAAGKPVVTTDVGGVHEIVTHTKTGFICAPENSDSLGEAMHLLESKPKSERDKMGKLGRVHIENNFSTDAIADRWMRVFER